MTQHVVEPDILYFQKETGYEAKIAYSICTRSEKNEAAEVLVPQRQRNFDAWSQLKKKLAAVREIRDLSPL